MAASSLSPRFEGEETLASLNCIRVLYIMKFVSQQIEHLMLRAAADALGLGLPRVRFPFTASMVAAVHTHKDGIGDGV